MFIHVVNSQGFIVDFLLVHPEMQQREAIEFLAQYEGMGLTIKTNDYPFPVQQGPLSIVGTYYNQGTPERHMYYTASKQTYGEDLGQSFDTLQDARRYYERNLK
jgi:hypothetical protein